MEENRMTFGAYLKAYFKQCLEVLKHPKMLLPTAILVVVWVGLGILQNKVEKNLPLSILNFLTFAQGGLYGGIFGAIGGILGKIVVAAFVNVMIVPLFYKQNPFANFKQGFNEVVSNVKVQGKEAVASLLKGAGVALLLYSIFNATQSFENSLVGIVSAVALITAVARKGGFLWGLVLSFLNSVSKKNVPTYQQIVRLLTGMTLGFSLGVVLCVFGSNWASSIGLIALIVGWIMGRGTKKEAVVATCLILCFLLPKMELWAASTKGKWSLVDVKTEINPTASWSDHHEFEASVALSGTTASFRVDYAYSFDNSEGYYIGSITPFYGSYAPGYVFVGESATRLEKGKRWMEIDMWNYNRFWNSYSGVDRDKGSRIGWELRDNLGTFNYTFPTREEVGSDQFIIEESVNLHGAYIRTAYYFEWNAKGKVISSVDDSDDGWEDDWDDDIEITLPTWVEKLFGTDGAHMPNGPTILIGILGALGGLGGGLGGTLGGGLGGGIPTGNGPAGNGPSGNGPSPEELEMERYQKEMKERFNKYVHDNPDGTKTYTDPATGEKHTLYPKYNAETGEFTHWENENDTSYDEDKLNDWLAWRERNNETFAQDAAQAQQNLEEQRAMNQAQNDYDRERGSSAMADQWRADKEQMEKDFEHEMRLRDLAWQHGAADEEELKKFLKQDTHKALQENAEEMSKAAYWNDWVNGTEIVESSCDRFIGIIGETSPQASAIRNYYTFAKSVLKHGSMGVVKGQGFGGLTAELAVGVTEGGLSVYQNEGMANVFGTSFGGQLAKTGTNVLAEGVKNVVNDLLDPNKSAKDILNDFSQASIKRIQSEIIGKATGYLAGKTDYSTNDQNTLAALGQVVATTEINVDNK